MNKVKSLILVYDNQLLSNVIIGFYLRYNTVSFESSK